MKKILKLIVVFYFLAYLFSNGERARVVTKLYEGYSKHNDLYIVALNGYYLPLIADDLENDNIIIYTNLFKAKYLESKGE